MEAKAITEISFNSWFLYFISLNGLTSNCTMAMIQVFRQLRFLVLVFGIMACSTVRKFEQLPLDIYSVPAMLFSAPGSRDNPTQKRNRASLELAESTLHIPPETAVFPPLHLDRKELNVLRFYRRTFDV